jgi:hypothetical protein
MAHTIRAIRQDRKESRRARQFRQDAEARSAMRAVASIPVEMPELTAADLAWLEKESLYAEFGPIDPTLCSKWVVL